MAYLGGGFPGYVGRLVETFAGLASGYDTAMAVAVDLDLRDWVAPGVALAPRLSIAARVNQSIG